MTSINGRTMPENTPINPSFSSGPCPKRPGWNFEALAKHAWLGRSHRAKGPKAQINTVIEKIKTTLNLPNDYLVGIVPASDTGAFEMAMWSMLGSRPVDVLVWESFSKGWASDITKELKIEANILSADYGELPDLSNIREDADLVFAWNGTTSGAKVPNGDFIKENNDRLVFCDATSAVFAQELPFEKLDVITFSFQKVLGGEGAHGVLILSPKAIKRLENYTPERPLPKIFRLTKNNALISGIFKGATINTPSMLVIADALDALIWVEDIGGSQATKKRADANFEALQKWVDERNWIENLVSDPQFRSNTSVCLKFTDSEINDQAAFQKSIVNFLENANAAYDLGAYRDAPPGLRIWCGATVETADIQILTHWLDYAYANIKTELMENNNA